MKTAFLIDGAFFLKRHYQLMGKSDSTPRTVARSLHAMCFEHLRKLDRHKTALYRIFYYDCPPLTKKVHDPITKKAIDFAKSPKTIWRLEFFEELKKLRKVALRMGHLDERSAKWTLYESALKDLVAGKLAVSGLASNHFQYYARQKGVDMRIGLDIASLSYKNQVDQIVLVSGDSDFVSAAKLARREGIDFILDPMWHGIQKDLHEHIDGLQGVVKQRASAFETSVLCVTPPSSADLPLPPGEATPG